MLEREKQAHWRQFQLDIFVDRGACYAGKRKGKDRIPSFINSDLVLYFVRVISICMHECIDKRYRRKKDQ